MNDKPINRIEKAILLKEYAISQGYEVEEKILSFINELASVNHDDVGSQKRSEFDRALSELTRLTFPVTIDTLSIGSESKDYRIFKNILFGVGIIGLILAILGFYLSLTYIKGIPPQVWNSILAIALGLLGAVVYSLFNVLRVIPPQTFTPSDGYANYARLLLGLLLGWIFYFTFSRVKFLELANPNGLKKK